MKSNYSCLEYSFNPTQTQAVDIESALEVLGFRKCSISSSGATSIWVQGIVLLVLRRSEEVSQPGISGIGMFVDNTLQQKLASSLMQDPESGVQYVLDPTGMRLLIINEDTGLVADDSIEKFIPLAPPPETADISAVTGIVYCGATADTLDFYLDFGFKDTASANDRYHNLVSDNNRFTIMMDKEPFSHANIKTIVTDTNDIFNVTASFIGSGLTAKKYEINANPKQFPTLMHKIIGYNCIPFGTEERFSIENFIGSALPGMDLIIRMRKKYFGINEETLGVHYGP